MWDEFMDEAIFTLTVSEACSSFAQTEMFINFGGCGPRLFGQYCLYGIYADYGLPGQWPVISWTTLWRPS